MKSKAKKNWKKRREGIPGRRKPSHKLKWMREIFGLKGWGGKYGER